jgi:hypothetical protein
MELTEAQQRILERKLALQPARIGPVTDGRRLVSESWGEEQTGEELRQLTVLLHYAVQMGEQPDYAEIGRIVAGTVFRYGLSNVTESDLQAERAAIVEMRRESAEESRWAA